MKIYTYYADCPTHDQVAELRLISLWRRVWTEAGWEPFVLSEWHARKSPFFDEYLAAVMRLPSVNSREYETACYMRWMALATVGGGYMADYDVFPAKRNDPSGLPEMTGVMLNRLQIFQNRNVCPSFVFAMQSVAEQLTRLFVAEKPPGYRDHNGRPHYSDMYALEDLVTAGSTLIETHDLVRDYQGSDGWEKAPYIHFANGYTVPRGLVPRWQHIPQLIA